MIQANLFDQSAFEVVFGTHSKKLARNDSPETSKVAAQTIDTGRLESLVLDTIKAFGMKGCISDEVRDWLLDMPYSSVTARYKALSDKGLIEYTGETRKGKSGRAQRVMKAVKS
jgi:hypothetical protein